MTRSPVSMHYSASQAKEKLKTPDSTHFEQLGLTNSVASSRETVQLGQRPDARISPRESAISQLKHALVPGSVQNGEHLDRIKEILKGFTGKDQREIIAAASQQLHASGDVKSMSLEQVKNAFAVQKFLEKEYSGGLFAPVYGNGDLKEALSAQRFKLNSANETARVERVEKLQHSVGDVLSDFHLSAVEKIDRLEAIRKQLGYSPKEFGAVVENLMHLRKKDILGNITHSSHAAEFAGTFRDIAQIYSFKQHGSGRDVIANIVSQGRVLAKNEHADLLAAIEKERLKPVPVRVEPEDPRHARISAAELEKILFASKALPAEKMKMLDTLRYGQGGSEALKFGEFGVVLAKRLNEMLDSGKIDPKDLESLKIYIKKMEQDYPAFKDNNAELITKIDRKLNIISL